MALQENTSLLHYNTFGVNVNTRYLFTYSTTEELKAALNNDKFKNIRILHIGCGSNLLFLSDFDGVIMKSEIKFIKETADNGTEKWIEAGAGIIWDDFVAFCVEQNYYGAENLSLIPGTVGASAVQNIGAYGVEAKDLIQQVNCIETSTGKQFTFEKSELQYGYRTSRFKTEWKNRFVITSVVYKLSTEPKLNISYKGLSEAIAAIGTPDLPTLRKAIIDIRRAKLPDPAEQGNAGSFFMNPVIENEQFLTIKEQYETVPHYILPNGKIKIPAAWLIEQCGWKGRTLGHAGVHSKQPLVLVNAGGANGNDIAELAQTVIADVFQKFQIKLTPEVIYIK